MILAGDVGGTKVDLVLCKFDNGQLLTVHDHKYHARDFPGLVQVVEAFLAGMQTNARVSRSTCWLLALECRVRYAMAA